MGQKIHDRSAKILLIEPSGTVRTMASEVLRGLGFQTSQGVASVQDALGVLEVEPIDWIITSLFAKDTLNALQLIQLCTVIPQLNNIRISLMIDEDESFCLRSAFEFGLLSWHSKPMTRETFPEKMKDLLARLEATDWNSCLTSADYLREYLKKNNYAKSLLSLEKGLLTLFPGNAKLLVHLAEAQYLSGEPKLAAGALSQAQLLDDGLVEQIDTLAKRFFGERGLQDAVMDETINTLGLETCILVDPDETVLRAVGDILEEINVKDIVPFQDGESAFEYIRDNPEPTLIIHEWRIPKLTGPFFLQKVRQHGYFKVPMIVLSSLVKKEDVPLVREMGVANVIEKPFDRRMFMASIIWTIQQDRLPTELQAMERKIREKLSQGAREEAEGLKIQYLRKPVPQDRKNLIEAEFAYYDKNYAVARELAIRALDKAFEPVLVLNLLGKAFMKLRQFDSALKCFQKAQSLSPLNIERLCAIAEVQTEVDKNLTQAKDTLDNAKSLDKSNELVKETEAKLEMSTGSTSKARILLQQLESIDNFVSYMNNRAISMTRTGDVTGGIDLYSRALDALPEERKEIRAIVHYNLALAFARNSDFAKAKDHLEHAIPASSPALRQKAMSLKIRIENALRTGKTAVLKFSTDEIKTPEPEPELIGPDPTQDLTSSSPQLLELSEAENRKVVAAVETSRGTMCCYLVFDDPQEKDPRSLKMIATLPRFTPRSAISRAESMGADRIAKDATMDRKR